MSDPNRTDRRRDAELGMSADIPRRDFLDGIAIGIGAAFAENYDRGETLAVLCITTEAGLQHWQTK